MKKVLIIVLPILLLISILVYFFLFRFNQTLPVSKNIQEPKVFNAALASINQPVFLFEGRIEKINDQTLTITGEPILEIPVPASGSANQNVLKLTLQALVTSATEISNSSLTGTTTKTTKISLADLKINQIVIASSSTDLRGLKGNEFTAESVMVRYIPVFSIGGKVMEIKDNVLTVQTFAPPSLDKSDSKTPPSSAPEKTYQVAITRDTKYSALSSDYPPKATSITKQDIKIGKDATVLTEDNPNSQTQITALSIILATDSK